MEPKADLHIHSCYSDSDLSIQEILKRASEKGLKAIAVTDHDTVEGVDEALQVSDQYQVECISGIEISAQYRDFEVHILGYLLDHHSVPLRDALSDIKNVRIQRLIDMAEKMNKLGFKVDTDELLKDIQGRIVTRFHLALYLVAHGIVSNIKEAFLKYLAPGKPAYAARLKFSAQEAIRLILDAGGVPVLAHPHMLADQRWIEEFIEYGIRGIEAVYPGFSKSQRQRYRKFAKEHDLCMTGGSDAHGNLKKYNDIGSVTVPYSYVEQMKDEQRRIILKRNV